MPLFRQQAPSFGFPNGLMKPWVSGRYYFAPNSSGSSTSAVLGVGTLRMTPFWVPNQVTLARIGIAVTLIGDVGSLFRLGIYNDDGNGRPGTLVLDAGTILGDSATAQEITISQALAAGQYHIGGAVQVVTITQPTMQIHLATSMGLVPVDVQTVIPNANLTNLGFSQAAVTGALPATFTASPSMIGAVPRVFVKVA